MVVQHVGTIVRDDPRHNQHRGTNGPNNKIAGIAVHEHTVAPVQTPFNPGFLSN